MANVVLTFWVAFQAPLLLSTVILALSEQEAFLEHFQLSDSNHLVHPQPTASSLAKPVPIMQQHFIMESRPRQVAHHPLNE